MAKEKKAESHETRCPNCGYCPTCGRRGIQARPYYWPQPYYPAYPHWSTQPQYLFNQSTNQPTTNWASTARPTGTSITFTSSSQDKGDGEAGMVS